MQMLKVPQGNEMEAAKWFAHSDIPLEEVVLRFEQSGKKEGLEKYCELRLQQLPKKRSMQRTMLSEMLIHYRCNKLNQLRLTSESGSKDPQFVAAYEKLKQFVADKDQHIDLRMVLKQLQEVGLITEVAPMPVPSDVSEEFVEHLLIAGQYKNALDYIANLGNVKLQNKLMTKYLSLFLKHDPKTAIESLILCESISVDDLLPSFLLTKEEQRVWISDYVESVKDKEPRNLLILNNIRLFYLALQADSQPPSPAAECANSQLLVLLDAQEQLKMDQQPLTFHYIGIYPIAMLWLCCPYTQHT